MELKICAILLIFSFRPKTMDYSPWFGFWEPKNVLEKRIPRKEHLKGNKMAQISEFVAPSIREYGSTLYVGMTREKNGGRIQLVH